MNKAILVIDMPKRCDDCKLSEYSDSWKLYCCYTGEVIDKIKPDWCPLKPMPAKIDVHDWDDSIKAKNENAQEVGMYMYDRGHYRGYNICIDKILGE